MKRRDDNEVRVVHQVASLCLDYPDRALVEKLPLLRGALAEQSHSAPIDGLRRLVLHLESRALDELQRGYVEVFDLTRKHTLYLSYWTDGDTRRRGEVLGRFKTAYRRSDFLVDTRGELPDYLPMVLEFAAVADPAAGGALLEEFRPSLELIRLALEELGTPYAGAVSAVCATLPGKAPADRAAVMAMAAGPPPTEAVGLEPYDPRLLPIRPTGGAS